MPPLLKKQKKTNEVSKKKNDKTESSQSESPEEPEVKDNTSTTDNPNGNSQAQEGTTENKSYPKTFKELGIIDQLCEACSTLGFKAPMPIQAESIPLALQGRDLIGLAETGSGKTAAFALPILQGM